MCGINGIYQFSGRSHSIDVIQRMNSSSAHRGPDAEGEFVDEYVLLGHRRLSIIDPATSSNQPFKSKCGRFVLIFNGEIYNYKEIRSQINDYDFITEGDTEVVLAAYMKWGENCLRMFNGMFGFAVWDSQKKELFIARDRLGIKPLYYVLTDQEIIFSSALKSILATNLIERKISQKSLVDYMRHQTVHAPYTIIDGLYELMPGQHLKLNEDGSTFKTYWSLTKNSCQSNQSITDVQKNIRTKLSESVERRLVSDVPFGAFLSGGIDSSIIVAMMSHIHDQKVDTFSVTFKEDEFSESIYAREIANLYNTNHHEIELSVEEFKDLIPDALSFMDHPSGDGPNTYVVSKKTHEAGIKMTLSGLGGDELFGGYSIFKQVPELQSKKWLSGFPSYARKPFAEIYHGLKGTVESSKIKEVLKLQRFDMELIYQFYRQVLMDEQVQKILPNVDLGTNRVFDIVHDLVGCKSDGWNLPPLSRISVAEISTYMQNVLLRDSDQMSMANGLELRVPFLDHELVEYVLGISDSLKKPITPKKLLVDACIDLIPESIHNRKKMGFVLPYDKWMRTELKMFCEERLSIVKGIQDVDENAIDTLWNQFLNHDKRVTCTRIWPLVVLGDWLKENDVKV